MAPTRCPDPRHDRTESHLTPPHHILSHSTPPHPTSLHPTPFHPTSLHRTTPFCSTAVCVRFSFCFRPLSRFHIHSGSRSVSISVSISNSGFVFVPFLSSSTSISSVSVSVSISISISFFTSNFPIPSPRQFPFPFPVPFPSTLKARPLPDGAKKLLVLPTPPGPHGGRPKSRCVFLIHHCPAPVHASTPPPSPAHTSSHAPTCAPAPTPRPILAPPRRRRFPSSIGSSSGPTLASPRHHPFRTSSGNSDSITSSSSSSSSRGDGGRGSGSSGGIGGDRNIGRISGSGRSRDAIVKISIDPSAGRSVLLRNRTGRRRVKAPSIRASVRLRRGAEAGGAGARGVATALAVALTLESARGASVGRQAAGPLPVETTSGGVDSTQGRGGWRAMQGAGGGGGGLAGKARGRGASRQGKQEIQ